MTKMQRMCHEPLVKPQSGAVRTEAANDTAAGRLRFPVSAPHNIYRGCHSVPVSCLAIATGLAHQDSGRRCCFSFCSQVLLSFCPRLRLVSTQRWGLDKNMQGHRWALSSESQARFLPCLLSHLYSPTFPSPLISQLRLCLKPVRHYRH